MLLICASQKILFCHVALTGVDLATKHQKVESEVKDVRMEYFNGFTQRCDMRRDGSLDRCFRAVPPSIRAPVRAH